MDKGEDNDPILLENEYWILRALALRSQVEASMGVLFTADIMLFAVWLIVFLMTEDNAWYNWLEFMQLFLWLGFLMLAAQSDNVERNLKYLLIVSALVFAVDLIVVAFVRPVGYDNVNPLNECKRNDKMILIILQAIFTGIDFVALCLAIYFAYASDLQKPAVIHRYQTINSSRLQYSTAAIKYALVEEYQKQVEAASRQFQTSQADLSLRLKALGANTSMPVAAAAPPQQQQMQQQQMMMQPQPQPAPPPQMQQQQQQMATPPAGARATRSNVQMHMGTPMRRMN